MLPFPCQVSRLHSMLTTKQDMVTIYVDQWGCKRLTSFCLRRFRTGQTNFRDRTFNKSASMSDCMCKHVLLQVNSPLQDAALQPLMDLMTEKWGNHEWEEEDVEGDYGPANDPANDFPDDFPDPGDDGKVAVADAYHVDCDAYDAACAEDEMHLEGPSEAGPSEASTLEPAAPPAKPAEDLESAVLEAPLVEQALPPEPTPFAAADLSKDLLEPGTANAAHPEACARQASPPKQSAQASGKTVWMANGGSKKPEQLASKLARLRELKSLA